MMLTFIRKAASAFGVLALLVSIAAAQDPINWAIVEDEWFALELAGSPCGFAHMRTESGREADGTELWRSSSDTTMRVGRAGAAIEVQIGWSFIETADGKPRSAEVNQSTGGAVMKSQYEFVADGVAATTTQGGRTTQRKLPALPGQWLTPHAADAYADAQRQAQAATYTVRMLDPSNGLQVVTAVSTRDGSERLGVGADAADMARWRTTNDLLPVPATEWFDAKGQLMVTETAMPFGALRMTRSTEAAASGKGAATVASPEIMLSTMSKPDQPIGSPRSAKRIVYRIRSVDGKPITLPSAGAQVVTPLDDGALEVVVDVAVPGAATTEEIADARFRDASPMLDSADERIQKLAAQGLKKAADGATPRERATTLRAFVERYIKHKGLSSAFASASEVAKSKSGDCSEHAMLLAALLRAANIPSRVAAGMVYVDEFAGQQNVFGWHMWTQALIDGKWVDLDATLGVDFDAAHLLAATTAQHMDAMDPALGGMVGLIGNLRIEVVGVGR